jgi:hypothetical protein
VSRSVAAVSASAPGTPPKQGPTAWCHRFLASDETQAAALTAAITELLGDPSYREAAQPVADAIQTVGPGEASADVEIEASVADRDARGAVRLRTGRRIGGEP